MQQRIINKVENPNTKPLKPSTKVKHPKPSTLNPDTLN